MSTFFDKKKILEDNKDLYISEYDKSLDVRSLAGIVEAKKEYNSAKSASDYAKMNAANQKANSIRSKSGNYTGGADGSEYNRAIMPYEINNNSYKSSYDSKRQNILSDIENLGEFSYDPESDPVFQSYKQIYSKLGDEAYERTLAKESLRTGGMVNTSAISAAMQAKNAYNSYIAELIPKLWESAYEKYSDSYERLYRMLDEINQMEDTEYNRHRDSVKDFENERKYFYEKDKAYEDLLFDRYKAETDFEADRYEFDKNLEYKKETALADDIYNQQKLADSQRKTTLSSAINLAKALYGKIPVNAGYVNSIINMIK